MHCSDASAATDRPSRRGSASAQSCMRAPGTAVLRKAVVEGVRRWVPSSVVTGAVLAPVHKARERLDESVRTVCGGPAASPQTPCGEAHSLRRRGGTEATAKRPQRGDGGRAGRNARGIAMWEVVKDHTKRTRVRDYTKAMRHRDQSAMLVGMGAGRRAAPPMSTESAPALVPAPAAATAPITEVPPRTSGIATGGAWWSCWPSRHQ